MGRPINKRFLGDAEDSIKVTHYRRATGSEVTGEDDTFIVSQRSTNKFLVSDTSGGWSEVLTLVDKDAGSLANGEFRIGGVDPDGSAVNITRLRNRTVRAGTTPNAERFAWSVTGSATVAVVNVTLPGNDPVQIEATAHGLTTGDVVTFQGFAVGGSLQLNGNTYTVTVTDADNFTLDGTDSALIDAYTTGGEFTVGGGGSIDLQDA